MMMRRFLKAVPAIALLLAFSLESGVSVRGQLIEVGKRGRRIGRIVLLTPPSNPNAGILSGPKGRGSGTTKTVRCRYAPSSATDILTFGINVRAPREASGVSGTGGRLDDR